MLPLSIDINPNWDASTTLRKDQIGYHLRAVPPTFDNDLTDLEELSNQELISVFTNLSIERKNPIEYIDRLSYFTDDFEIISKFQFKSSKTIKARIKRSKFKPLISID